MAPTAFDISNGRRRAGQRTTTPDKDDTLTKTIDRTERSQSGAAMVELAVILPIFVLLLFGMIEASWAFAQSNDVRHGAREGARLAAVDFGDVATIGAEVCDRMDVTGGGVTITLSPGSSPADPGDRGSTGRIQVSVVYSSITGAVDQFFDGKTLSSDIDFILEQPLTGEAQWWNTGSGGTFTCTS